ncbi:trigger factor [Thermoanaerobacterium thermosaccharolyticum]|uniref:Trigger factor n=1 Tax=Thermoanaerobacterium thermosaccharolyticum TaxID=1517 RepID=A0A223I1W1_THETR|nr:trigger factor [Thermoanaerobacterium thermosaccharolyticum]AST58505.1 trigger factor [Thermoanaerobacterium thermosaccharolyticum]KAA5808254.1 trigger factor [Thermoanaerobacterium thermosaccharolyticum]PHO08139.1 trigger factor [Thermoanaerobacterium thermosaccharolyticum]TCW40316.1 trigger factor [Thermohydrogenium kirishiense]
MSSNLKKLENSVATIELNIPKEKFEEGLNFSYKKNVGRFNVPGFRRGRAPRIIIERYYGEGVLYEDAIEHLFPDAYQEAIDSLKIEPIDSPSIDILQIGKGKDLIIEAVVPVMPDVELGQYKGIEVKKVEYNVKDEDVENRLEQMRQRNARVVPVEDRAAQMGDIVDISFEGFIDGKPFEGGKSDNYSLELGSKTFIPGFEEQIVGHNINDEFDVNVKFPEDYRVEELKGKDAVFKVKLLSIKYKELPELNDDFAKDVSEFDTLDELKEDIKRELKEQYNKSAEEEMKENAVKAVVENAKVEIPEVMIDRQIDISLRDLDYNLRYQGLNLDKYLEITGKSKDDLRKEMHDDAALRVKTQLVVDKIGKVENITATDEEIDNRLNEMAKNYNVNVEDLKKELNESQINNIKDDIVYFKTIDFIFENSKIVDKEE